MNFSPSYQIMTELFGHMKPHIEDHLVRHIQQFKSTQTWCIADHDNVEFIGNLVQTNWYSWDDAWSVFNSCVQGKLQDFQTRHETQDEVLQQQLELSFQKNLKKCLRRCLFDGSWLEVDATDEAFVGGLVLWLVEDIRPRLHHEEKDIVKHTLELVIEKHYWNFLKENKEEHQKTAETLTITRHQTKRRSTRSTFSKPHQRANQSTRSIRKSRHSQKGTVKNYWWKNQKPPGNHVTPNGGGKGNIPEYGANSFGSQQS